MTAPVREAALAALSRGWSVIPVLPREKRPAIAWRAYQSRAGLLPGIDLRGDGGCVVVPPSIHPSGKSYAWIASKGPDERGLAPLPEIFLRAHP
jgi:hypothetical protein